MKVIPTILLSLSSFLMFGQNNLTLNIDNIESTDGLIRIALYNSENDFLKKEYKTLTMEPKISEVQAVFEDIPDGEYVVALLHDENGNQMMDKNFMGIPKEPYSFSRIPKVLLSEPDFDDVSFKITSDHKERITLR